MQDCIVEPGKDTNIQGIALLTGFSIHGKAYIFQWNTGLYVHYKSANEIQCIRIGSKIAVLSVRIQWYAPNLQVSFLQPQDLIASAYAPNYIDPFTSPHFSY